MSIQTVEISLPESIIKVVEVRQGPAGPGGGGTNSITSATTSDGTADLDLLNVETVTATVTGTLTAPHIHGNLAGSVYAHIRAGEALAKGDPVYVSGSHGSGANLIPIVSKADASNAAKMPAIGIMDEAVANNANGHMVIVGTITELDTTGLTVNAELYVAAGGGMTATPPTARAQPVARVERVNANNGAVIVKVNGLSASDATANTLVRRDASGNFSAGTITASLTGTASDVNPSGTSIAAALSGKQPLDTDLTSWAGVTRAAGFDTFTGTPSSANLRALVTDETGTGALVFGTGPTFAGLTNTGALNLATGTTFTYGTGIAASHLFALGATTTGLGVFTAIDPGAARIVLGGVANGLTGSELFGAATAVAARTTLGFDGMVPKIPIVFSNSSDFSTASTGFVDVTGLSFPVEANKNYSVNVFLSTNKNDAAGMSVQFTGPASPTRLFFRCDGASTSIGGNVSTTITSFSSPMAVFNSFNGDGFLTTYGRSIIRNGANAGTVQVQLRAVTSGTAKIYAGSYIQVTEL
jgi:hypothetical protein